MAPQLTVQLFAKAPVPGTVKTRLIPTLGSERAAALYMRMVEHAAAEVATACASIGNACGELWCSPDMASEFLRALARQYGLTMRKQCAGDLGSRMRDALQSAMPGRAMLLGSDCPLLDARALLDADQALRVHDAVFIPADDGGYALVGFRDSVADCFTNVAWSTERVMAQTRASLGAARKRWAELPSAWDVDTAADLARLSSDVRFSHLLVDVEPGHSPESDQSVMQPL